MPPDPPSVLAPLALDPIPDYIWTAAGLAITNWEYLVLRFLITQKDVSFFSRKGFTFRINTEIYILRTAGMRSTQA